MLEYTGVSSGRLWFRFKRDDDATRFIIRYRSSTNGGVSWSDWTQTQEIGITTGTDGYTAFNFAAISGLMYECCVIMTGDEKDPSELSNIVTVLYPNEPVQAPPEIEGFVFYYNGKPRPGIKPIEVPDGVTAWAIWYREFGSTTWNPYGVSNGGIYTYLTADVFQLEQSYQFIIAWYDATNSKIISDISNVITIALPEGSISYLIPPKKLNAYFYDDNGTPQNRVQVQRGDMRATAVGIEYKRSTVGVWTPMSSDFIFSEHGITDSTTAYYMAFTFGSDPISGEVWQYRMKNKADGYETSEYSDIFYITIPSFLPRLESPAVTLQQEGYYVLIGWQTVANAAGYKIERRSSLDSTWTVITSTLAPTATRYDDYSTSYGNTYFYRVTALGDNQLYQDSLPTEESITVTQAVTLPAPVIDSVTESGISVVVAISNINTPNTDQVILEMSENNGSWKVVARDYPASSTATMLSITVPGESILEGGTLRFRAYCTPAGMAEENSPYSEIASITIDEREWLLRWTGTEWDDPSGLTGGWVSEGVAWSTSDTAKGSPYYSSSNGEITFYSQSNGTAWYRTRNAINISQFKSVGLLGTVEKSSMYCRAAFGMWIQGYGTAPTTLQPYVYSVAMKQGAATGNLDNPTVSAGANYACYIGLVSTADGSEGVTGVIHAKGIIAIKR